MIPYPPYELEDVWKGFGINLFFFFVFFLGFLFGKRKKFLPYSGFAVGHSELMDGYILGLALVHSGFREGLIVGFQSYKLE